MEGASARVGAVTDEKVGEELLLMGSHVATRQEPLRAGDDEQGERLDLPRLRRRRRSPCNGTYLESFT